MKTTIRSACIELHNGSKRILLIYIVSSTTAYLCMEFFMSLWYVCVMDRTPPQRSVFTLSFTSVQESKGVTMRRTYLLASASAQPPQRCVNLCVCLAFFPVLYGAVPFEWPSVGLLKLCSFLDYKSWDNHLYIKKSKSHSRMCLCLRKHTVSVWFICQFLLHQQLFFTSEDKIV